MKAKKNINIRQVCGQNLIVSVDLGNADFNNIISMNDTSLMLWETIRDKDFTIEDLAQILQNEFQIDENTPLSQEQAMKDASEIVVKWKEAGLLEE